MRGAGIEPIDYVVVNLYPFERTMKNDTLLVDAVENIDIGGPAMLRSAAKTMNELPQFAIEDYPLIISELKRKKKSQEQPASDWQQKCLSTQPDLMPQLPIICYTANQNQNKKKKRSLSKLLSYKKKFHYAMEKIRIKKRGCMSLNPVLVAEKN